MHINENFTETSALKFARMEIDLMATDCGLLDITGSAVRETFAFNRFFDNALGFECTFMADNYAFIRRDNAALRIIEVDAHIDMQDEKREQSCYIDVEDVLLNLVLICLHLFS